MLELNKIHQGDCLELMKDIPDKSVDMILCDLPYGVTSRNEWDKKINTKKLFREYRRIIKQNGVICLTATQPFATELISEALDIFRYDLIWEKSNSVGFLNANRQPLRVHEIILVFYKNLGIYNPQKEEGKPYSIKRKNGFQGTNYGEVKPVDSINITGRFPKSIIKIWHDKDKFHPTQKPVALCEYLIKTYTNERDIILDNCIGSGTTAIACVNTKRNFIGIELSEKYCKIANERIKKAKISRSV